MTSMFIHTITIHHIRRMTSSPITVTWSNILVPYRHPSVTMPIVPMSLGTGASSHLDPALPLDPILRQPPCHPTTTFQHLPTSDSTLSLSPSRSFDSESYSSQSPLSMDDHSLVISPSEMSDQTQFWPSITAPIGQRYALTVPSEAVEFPPISGSGDFFQCRWTDCGIWIASDKEAVRNHLVHTHHVVLRGTAESARCEWVGCSSFLQRNGLVRHFQTHLELRWLCSVCKGAYARQDSVRFHARKVLRCQLAQAISHPSTVAYSARRNEDSTVTLTKILQP
ncbi:hypothetical protein J3R83DRAFT_2413 [Lanmaoa asiatica]|nr:hypothetical protein J3R83DRAFT_2413 [Lanmaoa asiatica]